MPDRDEVEAKLAEAFHDHHRGQSAVGLDFPTTEDWSKCHTCTDLSAIAGHVLFGRPAEPGILEGGS